MRTVDKCAVNKGRAAKSRLPEGKIKDVVQTEGNEYTFNKAVNQRSHVARAQYQIAEGVNRALDIGPDKEHKHSHDKIRDGGYNGNKSCAAEEGDGVGQLYFIQAVMQPGHAKTDYNASENAHLQ